MSNPQIGRLRTLGLMFCLLGGVLITFGWMGTARVACVDCQMPYLLSGGAAGLGLIVIGVGLLLIAQLRAEGEKLAALLTATVEPVDPVEPAGTAGTTGPDAPSDAAADPTAPADPTATAEQPVVEVEPAEAPGRHSDTEPLSLPRTS